jgi:hypothetical protein
MEPENTIHVEEEGEDDQEETDDNKQKQIS